MTRSVSTPVANAVATGHYAAIILVEMDFPDGSMRVNNSSVTFTWNGYSWLGIGTLGGIEAISEGASLEARGLTFKLSGVPTANAAVALGQQYQGRSCKVWFAPLDPTTHVILADPVMTFSGQLDTMDIDLGESMTISVTAESRLADWARPRVRRYNDDDQKAKYPMTRGLLS